MHHAAEGFLLAHSLVLLCPVGGFLELALKVPRDERDDEQHEEDDARCQQTVEGSVGAGGQKRRAVGSEAGKHEREDERQDEDDGRATAPGELADADVRGALSRRGGFGDVAPRRGNACADREARQDDADDDHGKVDGDHGDEDAERVDEQIVLVDDRAAEFVGQEATDQRADGSAEGVGADGTEDGRPGCAEAERCRPGGQRDAARDDAAGIEEVGQGNRYGRFPFLRQSHSCPFLCRCRHRVRSRSSVVLTLGGGVNRDGRRRAIQR